MLSVVSIPIEQLYLFLNTLYICIVVSEYIPQMKEYWVLLKAYQAEVDCFLQTWYINATCIELVWISLFYNTHKAAIIFYQFVKAQ